MSRIFISHSSANNAEAKALSDWLEINGWDDVFLDIDPERGLKPGERWQAELKCAANRCELIIFLISPAWAASKWCFAEFVLGKSMNKRVFGVMVERTPFGGLPPELTFEWQLADLSAGTRDYEKTVTLPPGDRTATVRFSSDGLNRLRIGLSNSGLDPKYFPWPPEDDPDRSPYPGLKPLDAEDAGIFFGRDGQIITGLDLLRGLCAAPSPRILVILGASGSGKSSFLRAGLLPRLGREDRHFFPLPVIRPERAVLSNAAGLIASLETTLKGAGLSRSRSAIRTLVEEGPHAVAELLSELARARTPQSPNGGTEQSRLPSLVLSIDQAEELFAADDCKEADSFLNLLAGLAWREDLPLITLFTIRSDSYEKLQAAPSLAGLHQNTLSLAPMPHGAYAEVIKGPARKLEGKLKIDDELVDALLEDIEQGGAKDALPLLAFTLEWLYREYGGDGNLTLSNYRKLGGIKGSIDAAVERALRAAEGNPKLPQDRPSLFALLRRGLIPWLAGIDTETGLPRRRIARLSEIPEETRPLVDLFVEQRLLATDVKASGEKTVEPAHEALLRQWGVLNGWLREDAVFLSVLDGLKRASRDWDANNRNAAWLVHTSRRLDDAERLLKRLDMASSLEPTDRDYLRDCREKQRAAAAKARMFKVSLAVSVLLLASAGLAWTQRDTLNRFKFWHLEMRASLLSKDGQRERIERAAQGKSALTGFRDCQNGCPEMLVVPGGSFEMGNNELPSDHCNHDEWDRSDCEGPAHTVKIAHPFAVSQTEITIDEWKWCVKVGPCRDLASLVRKKFPKAADSWPMVYVTWEDCQAYVQWLSRISGQKYRLLSEAEWEYVARAGTTTRFSFGNNDSQLGQYAWYENNSGQQLQPVGKKKPNSWGFQDLYGNAQDWVEDTLHFTYSGGPTDGSAWGQTGGSNEEPSRRIVRGGNFEKTADKLGSGVRAAGTIDRGYPHVGFRVARELEP